MAKTDLSNMTRAQLEKLRAEVDKAIGKLKQREMKDAIAAAEKAAAAHGFKLSELTGGDAPKKRGPKAAKPKTVSVPKYANPADKTQTWTGKGRQPEWFKAEIAKGTDPEKMAI